MIIEVILYNQQLNELNFNIINDNNFDFLSLVTIIIHIQTKNTKFKSSHITFLVQIDKTINTKNNIQLREDSFTL